MWKSIRKTKHLENALANTQRRTSFQMHGVLQILLTGGQLSSPCTYTQWGETIQMRRVRPTLQPKLLGDNSHEDTHRGQTLSMQNVQQVFLRQLHPHKTSEDPQWRETLLLSHLSHQVLPVRQFEPTHENSPTIPILAINTDPTKSPIRDIE